MNTGDFLLRLASIIGILTLEWWCWYGIPWCSLLPWKYYSCFWSPAPFSVSEWVAGWPGLCFRPNPRLLLKKDPRKSLGLKLSGTSQEERAKSWKGRTGRNLRDHLIELLLCRRKLKSSHLATGSKLETFSCALSSTPLLSPWVCHFSYAGER